MTQKIIILSGVSKGLGLAMVKEFIALGHVIWGCARSPDTIIRSLQSRWRASHQFQTLDVSDDGAVKRWADDYRPNGEWEATGGALIQPYSSCL